MKSRPVIGKIKINNEEYSVINYYPNMFVCRDEFGHIHYFHPLANNVNVVEEIDFDKIDFSVLEETSL